MYLLTIRTNRPNIPQYTSNTLQGLLTFWSRPLTWYTT